MNPRKVNKNFNKPRFRTRMSGRALGRTSVEKAVDTERACVAFDSMPRPRKPPGARTLDVPSPLVSPGAIEARKMARLERGFVYVDFEPTREAYIKHDEDDLADYVDNNARTRDNKHLPSKPGVGGDRVLRDGLRRGDFEPWKED